MVNIFIIMICSLVLLLLLLMQGANSDGIIVYNNDGENAMLKKNVS